MKRAAIPLAAVALFALIAGGNLIPSSSAQAPQASASSPQQVVVHLSHFTDDLHRSFMALKLAGLMQNSGADVTLFLDLEGVRLAERRQHLEHMTWGESPVSLAEHYAAFTEAGGKVVLCPHCAGSARIGEMALRRNATIADKDDLARLFMNADKILDY
ncbi:DsrE family protein [Maioricimonas sp. JC845]|uniref:DsrE family protein n=1 Tax=Maioricimonas sp. JC845 TaxID=3232138 RepID=UPI00345966E0